MDEFKNDHDALVTLVSEVRQAREDINSVRSEVKDLKDGVVGRVEALERWRASVTIYLAIYGVIGAFLAVMLIYHLSGK